LAPRYPVLQIAGNPWPWAAICVYLIATPQGNILINSDFKQDGAIRKASRPRLQIRGHEIV
jgi:hypothetical protein